MSYWLRIQLAGLCVLCGAANSYAISVSATGIDFGTIVQTSNTTDLAIDSAGIVSITGGTRSGTSSVGNVLVSITTTHSNFFERVSSVSVASGTSKTLDGCTAQVLNASLGNSADNAFSIARASVTQCRGLSDTHDVPVIASLRLTGACAAGTYTLTQDYTFNNNECNAKAIKNCNTISSQCSQNSQTASVPVTFTIESVLGITERQSLDFGTIVSSSAASQQITVNPDGSRSGGIFANSEGKVQQGIFSLAGTANTEVKIDIDNTVEISNGKGNAMTATLLTDRTTIQLDANGNETLNVGGTLTVAPNQPAGEYTGTYAVRVSY